MTNTPSQDIVSALVAIDDRLSAPKLTPEEKQQLTDAKALLGLQYAEIGRKELTETAKAIAAAAERLEQVIKSANSSPFSEYSKQLQDALRGLGLGRPDAKPSPANAGSKPPAPAKAAGNGAPRASSSALSGRGAPLSQQGLENVCRALSVSAAEIWAIVFTETDAPYGGFYADGWPQILFEQHIFHRLTNGQFDQTNPDISSSKPGNYGAGGRHQYDRLQAAMALDESAALQSASWGMGQTLGTHYKVLGYASARALVLDMFASEDQQLMAMAKEIIETNIANTLAAHDWKNFARIYNGPNYAINNYDEHLRSWYAKFATGALPDINVRTAQAYLMYLGFHPSDLDGLWGSRTQSSLNQYQRSKQIHETSQIDEQTLQMLAADCRQRWAQTPGTLFN
jgi:hypothetical protein